MNEETTFINLNDIHGAEVWLKKRLAHASVKLIRQLHCTESKCTFKYEDGYSVITAQKNTTAYDTLLECQKRFPSLSQTVISSDGSLQHSYPGNHDSPTKKVELMTGDNVFVRQDVNDFKDVVCDDGMCVSRLTGVVSKDQVNYKPLKTLYDTFCSKNRLFSVTKPSNSVHDSCSFNNGLGTGLIIGGLTMGVIAVAKTRS